MWEHVKNTRKFVKEFIDAGYKIVSLDTETYYNPALEGVALTKWIGSNKNNAPFGVSLAVGDTGWWVTKDFGALRQILEDESITKILHNAKFDIHMLKNIGIEIKGKIWDSMVMIHLINEEQWCRTPDGKPKPSKRLKDLAYHFLGDDGHKYEDALLEIKKTIAKETGQAPGAISYKELNDRDPETMKDYAISDTVFTYKLWEKFMPMLEAQELQEAYDRDLKALLAIVEIERTGLQVDIEGLRKLKEDMALEIVRKQQAVYKITGEAFNMNSAEELKSMFEKLGVVWQWYTDKGNVSDNKNVMEYLEKTFEGQPAGDMARLVLEIRKASKTLSTFIEGLIMFSDTDGRVHCDFNLCPKDDGKGGTVTGRLSSSSPNMQNVTKKDSNIRKLIAAEPGFILVEGDYSQQEYRLLAHYCKDPNLMQAIENGWDVHQATASMIEHVPYEEVTPAQRKASKAINFSLVYGTGLAAFAKAAHLKIDDTLYNQGMFYIRDKGIKPWDATLERCLSLYDGDARAQEAIRYYFSEEPAKAIAEAKKLKEEYFARFPLVQTFLEDVIATCKSRGYIRMWDGRRRHFKSPKSEAYKAPNALIQGGCGSITKEKIAECVEYLKDKKSKMVNTIHDSLVWQIHLSELDIVEDLRAILDNNNFRVPITCDIEAGWNWGEMTKIKSVDDLRRIVNGVCEKIS